MVEKENRTPEENDMLQLLTSGGNRVCGDNLTEFMNWYMEAK